MTALAAMPLFATLEHNGHKLHLAADLQDLRPAIESIAASEDPVLDPGGPFWQPTPTLLPLGKSLCLDLHACQKKPGPQFWAAAKNIAVREPNGSIATADVDYLEGARLRNISETGVALAMDQIRLAKLLQPTTTLDFAGTASYMGSKRPLGAFVVEAISSAADEQTIVIDIMCGSGSASGATSQVWRTIASDAQLFATVLASAQGGIPENPWIPADILRSMRPAYETNRTSLTQAFSTQIQDEDSILRGGTSPAAIDEYRDHLLRYSAYRDDRSHNDPRLYVLISDRRVDPTILPYCLFTACYTNVFFGLHQAIDIDSIRYAIDLIDDTNARVTAMAALVATVSASGSTYGGHFAQPLVATPDRLTPRVYQRVFRQRSISIVAEFEARFRGLTGTRTMSRYPVTTVPGPWSAALTAIDERIGRTTNVVVYVDAPYKREEYSRYYHVLETLVQYNYPNIQGLGRMPEKGSGNRFSSPFFSRSVDAIETEFIRLFEAILLRGWTVAWSYSNLGAIQPSSILNRLKPITSPPRSFAANHHYNPQGKRAKRQEVQEQIFILKPLVKEGDVT